jgi:hypothetical protein
MIKAPLESAIKRQILDLLHFSGVYAYNNRNTGLFTQGKWIPAPMKGVPDIVGFLSKRYGKNAGRAVYIEVKRPGNNKINPAQEEFLREALVAGCLAMKAYSAEEVSEELKKWI